MDAIRVIELLEKTSKKLLARDEIYFKYKLDYLNEDEAPAYPDKDIGKGKDFYRLEDPTNEKYVIDDPAKPRRALIDLVIIKECTSAECQKTLIEFKKGPADPKNIKKDFAKMIKEKEFLEEVHLTGKKNNKIEGACFFHVLPDHADTRSGGNEGSKNKILKKYYDAYEEIHPAVEGSKKWFVLFILDCNSKTFFSFAAADICDMGEQFKIICESNPTWKNLP